LDSLNDIFIDEEILTGVNPGENPIDDYQEQLIEMSIDDVVNDEIMEGLFLDALVDIFFRESPEQEEQPDDVSPELIEKEMLY
jgi:translation elongation factor EF-G